MTDKLTGPQVRDMITAAAARVERHAAVLNAINVYPVPDGDTGTNMHLTLRSVVEEAQEEMGETAGAMLKAMSRGALMGARGNSGVILSQIVYGLSEAAGEAQTFDVHILVNGLDRGAEAAYRAVTNPREGTMLTVARGAADSARAAASDARASVTSVLTAAMEGARATLAKTPELLPVLKEAGVVDAGGQGLTLLLEGAASYLTGEEMPMLEMLSIPIVEQNWVIERAHMQESGDLRYGFCTEFVVHRPSATMTAIRESLNTMGDSIVLVGDQELMRVHIHTDTPDDAIGYGRTLGEVTKEKVDNIQDQTSNFFVSQQERSQQLSGTISIVAVAAGDGLVDVFRSLGAAVVVRGGQSMNPSVQEILAAVEACPTPSVILLPNNKNVVLTANQAVALTAKSLQVVPTITIPQGVTALLSFNPNDDIATNSTAMEEAKNAVRTLEITRAVRATSVQGVEVREGQSIALIDDELALAAESPQAAAMDGLARLASAELMTVYYGKDVTAAQVDAFAGAARQAYPSLQMEVVYGGQPHYDYIISVE
jgi:DAK2 domain fusion protein YloV